MNPFPPLTSRERGIVIAISTMILAADLVQFPSVAHGTLVEAAEPQPITVQRIVINLPSPPSTAQPNAPKVVLENPYSQDLQQEQAPAASPGPTPTALGGVAGDRAQMGDITGASTPGLVDLGHGDSTALVRDGGDTTLVRVGSVVGGHHIVSISLAGGVRLDDGTVLPEGSDLSAPAAAAAAPAPSASATAAAVLPAPPLLPQQRPMLSRTRYPLRGQQPQGGAAQ